MSQAIDQNTTLPIPHNREAYDRQAIATMAAMAPAATIIPAMKPCPFCLSEPGYDSAFHGRAVVYCSGEDCEAQPQVMGTTLADAIRVWNRRNHPGYGERK